MAGPGVGLVVFQHVVLADVLGEAVCLENAHVLAGGEDVSAVQRVIDADDKTGGELTLLELAGCQLGRQGRNEVAPDHRGIRDARMTSGRDLGQVYNVKVTLDLALALFLSRLRIIEYMERIVIGVFRVDAVAGEAAAQTRALLETKEALELVDEALIPALDIVGNKYEKGTLYLPQLLQAASAAQSAFEEIKTAIAQKGEGSASKGRIVIATVKGDVHDIGKNIVKVILENYGFEVIDLGRDVPVETVVNTVREKNVHLVGLSALMTTTLKSMEETIAALHAAKLDCKIMVGGAVLTPEYAEKIGADWYAKDAKRSADIAKEFFGV